MPREDPRSGAAEVTQLQALLDRCAVLLRRLEWRITYAHLPHATERRITCPTCSRDHEQGHAPACDLRDVLAALNDQPPISPAETDSKGGP